MLNIYLDIDGVVRGCASPKEDIENFLNHCLAKYPNSIYWLTTHCNHGVNRAPEALQGILSQELVDRLADTVKPTEWEILKTDAIDKDQDFVWFDDNLFESEERVLDAYNIADGFFRMNSKDSEMAKKVLNYLKRARIIKEINRICGCIIRQV